MQFLYVTFYQHRAGAYFGLSVTYVLKMFCTFIGSK